MAVVGTADSSLNSISLNYNMAYAHIKPILLTGGELQAGSIQEWRVNTSLGALSDTVTMTLGSFNFPSDCATVLSIYDGANPSSRNLLFSGCQSSDKITSWLYSNTQYVYVVLDNSGRSSDLSVDFIDLSSRQRLFRLWSAEYSDARHTSGTIRLPLQMVAYQAQKKLQQ